MTFLGYKMVNGQHNGAKILKSKKAVVKFIVSDQTDKIITDEVDNFVMNTMGMFIDRVSPDYMDLRAMVLEEQAKLVM